MLLVSSFACLVKGVPAEDETLAQAISRITSNVNQGSYDSWLAVYNQILSVDNCSAFDYAISDDISKGNYLDALLLAELAELNNYTSPLLVNCTIEALEKMPMCGSLPITFDTSGYGDPNVANTGAFMLYHRFIIHAYKYAEKCNYSVFRWNRT